ncbi:MAG: glycosyltransferase family 2 protein [Muribaculaceae bacterium]|nr:glycosyltransferase family 2 protein [Muribaculaceae bacterium]
MKKISFIIPCHNEAENVDKLHSELMRFTESSYVVNDKQMNMCDFEWEFLFVNDGSKDSTLEKLKAVRKVDPRASVLNLSRNFGKENAMLAGMDYAGGDAVVIIDADLQDPLNVIPEMIYWWERGYDDVYGKRLSRGKESRIRKILSLSFYKMLGKMTDIDILPNVGDFRLLDRRAIRALTQLRETQRYMKGLYCWVGFKKKEVDFDRADREAGKSNFHLVKLINLAIEGITSYTTSPLRYATISGLLVSLCAFIYLIYILVKTLVWGEVVAGFPTLICVILFLGGMQLLALGIIGEYIGRIFNETKGRPPYLVESYNEEVKGEK